MRFFLRGVGKLQEHHLKDFFQRFGEVLEVSLVRDKKTQRPRGMAFLTMAPRAAEGTAAADDLMESVTGDIHTINEMDVEVQEALPNPKSQAEADGGAATEQGEAAAPAAERADTPAAQEEPAAPTLDPEAEAQAQAQWQMHYLALAINASVPEMGKLMPKQPPALPPRAPQRGSNRHPGAVPKSAGGATRPAAYGAVPPRAARAGAGPY
mmetsp:Transcript_104979/g.338531  ORF Transcript_104979/g.338531 Transcript_104979/m.338531 type:complete len:210 (+) Transcript_104979:1093-1722(+)